MENIESFQEMFVSLTPREVAVLRMRFGIKLSDDDSSEDVSGWPPLITSHNNGSGGSSAPAVPLDPIKH